MKIAPNYISKKTLINMVSKRNNKLIERHIKIDTNLPQENLNFIKKYQEPLSKLAKRNNCRLLFVNQNNSSIMDIERRHKYIYSSPQILLGSMSFTKEGKFILPQNITEEKSLINTIRKFVKNTMDKANKVSSFHIIDAPISIIKNNSFSFFI